MQGESETPPAAFAAYLWRKVAGADLTYRLLVLAVVAALWQVLGDHYGGLLIPNFTETVGAIGSMLIDPQVWKAFYISNQALFLGFGCALILGIPAGLAMGRYRSAERFTDVYLNILLVTPMAALIPILLMSVGIGLASRVILVTVFSVVMVIVNCRTGVRQVDPSLIEMARSFGASEWQIWLRILLPGALPAIMTGVRIGLGRAVTGMVIVELLMVSVGIGGLVLKYRGQFEAGHLYGIIVLVVVEALLLISVARWCERRAAPWSQDTGRRRAKVENQ